MVGELVMLPVRIGVRVTRVWFRALEETVSATTNVTGRVIELLASRSSNGAATEAPPEPVEREVRPDRASERELRPVSPVEDQAPIEDPAPTETAAPSVSDEPAHVSEEPVLVDEFAEPGAEEGAGAEVHVDPPWDGYERMNAKQVIARLASADAAALAAVQLYEGANRRRQTVMNAVERTLRIKNASNSHINQTTMNHQRG